MYKRQIYDDWISPLRILAKYYTYDVVLALIEERCSSSKGAIKSRVEAITDSIKFFSRIKAKNIVESNTNIIKYILTEVLYDTDSTHIDPNELELIFNKILDIYCTTEDIQIQSHTFRETFLENVETLFGHLTTTKGKSGDYALVKLPRFNTDYAVKHESIQSIFSLMFDDDIFSSVDIFMYCNTFITFAIIQLGDTV